MGTERLVTEIASDITWAAPPKPGYDLLVPQVHDLFGRLFARAKRLYISKLKPGLTGAAVVLARPTWNFGMGPSYVVKIGRREKVELEAQRYDDFANPYLPPNTTTQVDVTFTQHLGALQYRFAEAILARSKNLTNFIRVVHQKGYRYQPTKLVSEH